MAIQYVGGRGAGRAGSTSPVAVAINSGLTGGIGAAAIAGDLVVVVVSTATQARQPSCAIATPAGYTPLTVQRTTATTYDTNVQVCYKIMGGTPDTSVTIPSTGNIADGQAYRIMVFRGVDPTNPMDQVATYATGTAVSNRPDGAAITPVTAGAWIVVAGGGAASLGTTLFTAAELSGFVSYNGADTNDGTVGMGYYSGWSSGAWNPAAWAGGNANAANSWGATTLALRPAATAQEITGAGQIASAEALGGPSVGVGVSSSGIASVEAFGSASIQVTVAPSGIPTAEVIGQPTVAPAATPQEIIGVGGISSAEVTGEPAVSAGVTGAGTIASGEVVGDPALSAAVTGAGAIPTGEAPGDPAIGAMISGAGAITSEGAIGSPTVSAVGADHEILGAGGIFSETVGSPTVAGIAAPQPTPGGYVPRRGPKVYFYLPDKKKRKPPPKPQPRPYELDARQQVTLRALAKIMKAGKEYQRKPTIPIDRKLLKFPKLKAVVSRAGGIESGESIGKPTISVADAGTRYEKALEEMLLIWIA